jgi:hypothetical protein
VIELEELELDLTLTDVLTVEPSEGELMVTDAEANDATAHTKRAANENRIICLR